VWTLCGDSELAEGSIWEALDKAGFYELSNLTAILDVNRLGQRGETEYGWNTDLYRRRAEAFGCTPIIIDGHDTTAIDRALGSTLSNTGRPTVIIAKTIKGKGFSEIENKDGWHGKALPPDMAERAIKELGGIRNLKVKTARPERATPAYLRRDGSGARPAVTLPTYKKEDKVATRKAYGDALLALAAIPEVVAMDGEVSNSTHADEFAKAHKDRFFEMYIAEQQLVATAVGMSVRDYKPFVSTFAAFFSRAYDFIRMAGISQANIRLVGSHAGVEIGQDGPSQMALEDLASMRAIHGSTVLYPSDPNQAAKLTRLMADTSGIVYMRTTRGAYPTIYEPTESFKVGGAKVVRQSPKDRVTLIGAGVTLHNCLAAADALAKKKIPVRVIDLYSVKPVDVKTLQEAARVTKGKFVIVEDHYPEGGIGAAVLEAFAADGGLHVAHLAVKGLPTSGKPEELMNAAGIGPRQIIAAATKLAAKR
jgi:transketolase